MISLNNLYSNRCTLITVMFISFSFSLLFCSCRVIKKSKTLNKNDEVTTKLDPSFSVSAQTRFFIKEIEDELVKQKVNLNHYNPSTSIIEKYNLTKIEDAIYVSGMIKIPDNFDISNLTKIGVLIGSQSGKITTVQIPIKNFDIFLNNNSIEYFQISEKVQIR